MSLGVFAFRLSVSTKHRRRIAAEAVELPLDLLITQDNQPLLTQNNKNIALNHRIVRYLLTQDDRSLITQAGDNLY